MSELNLIFQLNSGEKGVIPLEPGTTIVISDDPHMLEPEQPPGEGGTEIDPEFEVLWQGQPFGAHAQGLGVLLPHVKHDGAWTIRVRAGGETIARDTWGDRGSLPVTTPNGESAFVVTDEDGRKVRVRVTNAGPERQTTWAVAGAGPNRKVYCQVK